jgi:hypothetical protein
MCVLNYNIYILGLAIMPKKRKSIGEDEFTVPDINPGGTEVYEKGGRVLRTRETCQCPVCGMYFSATEIQVHAQACLYILYFLILLVLHSLDCYYIFWNTRQT